MKIYLIRHGKTLANVNGLYCGSSDIPLCEEGIKLLKEKRYTVPADSIFITSGMERTNQTLKLLFGDVPYTVQRDLREIDFGIFELKSYEQLKDNADYIKWISGDNNANTPPEGESGADMQHRVKIAFEGLLKQKRNMVIISHGGVIAAIMQQLFPKENKNLYQWQPKQGEGYIIEDNRYSPLY